MTLETFFDKFDQFADAPNAVARVRRFILDLAVRGKLVEQDTEDDPADELLKRVQAEKARLIKSGKIKKQEQLPPVADDTIPFDLPAGWAASQLGDIAVCLDYMREPINGTERDLRIAGKAESELFPYYGATQQQGLIDDYIFDDELVLLGEDGVPFYDDLRSKAYLISGKTWVNNHAHVFRGILVSNPFVMHWLNTFDYTGRVAGSTRSKLNQAKAVDIPIALPPLAEQKRIVAKVDELMALCDRLEAQQQERQTRRAALARAALARFAEAPTPANLEMLFYPSPCPRASVRKTKDGSHRGTEAQSPSAYLVSPADLRKSILTLAVQGKLVPQDHNDEPAKDSLARNDKRRRETAHSDHRADEENQPLLSADDRWDIAETWAWRGLADLVLFVDYRGKTPAKLSSGVRLLTAKNVRKGQINLSPEEFLSESEYHAWMTRGFPKAGDVLFTTEAPMGYAAVVELTELFALAQRVICFQSYGALDPAFLVLQILSDQFQFILDKNGTGVTAKGIKASKLKQLPIAIPPLAEQRRIVAKVEQLMALVAELETQLAASRASGEKLLTALVAELTAGKESHAALKSRKGRA
jgi:type I restriction enzyme S subunit